MWRKGSKKEKIADDLMREAEITDNNDEAIKLFEKIKTLYKESLFLFGIAGIVAMMGAALTLI